MNDVGALAAVLVAIVLLGVVLWQLPGEAPRRGDAVRPGAVRERRK